MRCLPLPGMPFWELRSWTMPQMKPLWDLTVGVKGAGDLASGLVWRLYQARIQKIYMLEIARPLAVRRRVAFSEAVYDGVQAVEGVSAVRVEEISDFKKVWADGQIPVRVDPGWDTLEQCPPDVMIDAIMAKRNLGTRMVNAPLVIGLGPGFEAGHDVDRVIETQRGHYFGRVLSYGEAEPDTGIPDGVEGYTTERVLRAPVSGLITSHRQIGDHILQGETVASVDDKHITAQIDGVLRGLIRTGVWVQTNMKVGDIDPRGRAIHCKTISDKARSLGGSVLEAILEHFNQS